MAKISACILRLPWPKRLPVRRAVTAVIVAGTLVPLAGTLMQNHAGAAHAPLAPGSCPLIDGSLGIHNVKCPPFDAIGDGVADDTGAIQTAIDQAAIDFVPNDSLPIGGGIVLFPSGIYRISSSIIGLPGVTLLGVSANQHATLKFGSVVVNTGTDDAIAFSGDTTQNKSGPFTIERLKIVGNPNSGDGIFIKDGQIVTIRDSHIVGHGGAGIHISAGINNSIMGNRIQDNWNGIEVSDQATTLRISENRIEDNADGAAGVKVSNSDLISILRNTIESNNGKGVWLVGPVIQTEIIGNWFEGNDQINSGDEDAFLEGGPGNALISRVTIQSNRFNSSGVPVSLRLQRVADSMLLGNLFAAASVINIQLTEGSKDNLILWNTLAGVYEDHGESNLRNEHSFRGNDLGTRPNILGRLNLNGNRIDDDSDAANRRSIIFGEGSPEGAVAAGVGSIFLRKDGTSGSALYVKESGSGVTGWVAK